MSNTVKILEILMNSDRFHTLEELKNACPDPANTICNLRRHGIIIESVSEKRGCVKKGIAYRLAGMSKGIMIDNGKIHVDKFGRCHELIHELHETVKAMESKSVWQRFLDFLGFSYSK